MSCSLNAWSPGSWRGARLPGRGGRALEDLRAGGERLEEGLLLDPHDGGDALEVGGELRVGRGHGVAHDLGERRQHRLVDAEQPGRAHDPAQQAAQHVAAALVGRGHAVTDDHDAGAGVVGDHPEADVVDLVDAVATAGELLGARDHRAHEVGVVDARHALQQGRDALDPHAGVDVLLRQRADRREVVLRRALAADVLHEDEVPDLQVAVLVGLRAAVAAVLGAAVEVDLRAGAAGAGDAHVPVVVLPAAALDAVLGQEPAPQRVGLVVVAVDGGPQPVGVDPVPAGDQRPGEVDGAFLEVVAEREVARHLEERVVPGGLADLFDVPGAHALLDGRGARVGRGGVTEEVRLELHHARVDEEQGGVVEDQRRAGHLGVARGDEVLGEPVDDLVGLHGRGGLLLREVVDAGTAGAAVGQAPALRARARGYAGRRAPRRWWAGGRRCGARPSR